jgi:hypothetical protein
MEISSLQMYKDFQELPACRQAGFQLSVANVFTEHQKDKSTVK